MIQAGKVFYQLIRAITGGLLLLILGGAIFWLATGYRAEQKWRQVSSAIAVVKAKVNEQTSASFSGCVYPGSGLTIVSVNQIIFFAVKDGRAFIPKITTWHLNLAKAMAPDLKVEESELDFDYLFEHCR